MSYTDGMSYQDLNLVEAYGENFRNNFNPFTRNIRKGTIMERKHHCTACGNKPPTKKCYDKDVLHYAFCLATVNVDGKDMICGERFEVKSPGGCAKHEYPDFNVIFKEALRGRELSPEAKGIRKPTPEEEAAALAEEAKKNEVHDYQWYQEQKQATLRERADSKKPRERTRTVGNKVKRAPTAKDYFSKKRKD
jgi:hypothetical protein